MKAHASWTCGPGQSVELLKELHILTRDGKLNQDSRRKLKQVYHLHQFIDEAAARNCRWRRRPDHRRPWRGQVLPGLHPVRPVLEGAGARAHLRHRDRAELVERSRELAQRLGFERMSFLHISAAEAADAANCPPPSTW
jgi:hypothetical protein